MLYVQGGWEQGEERQRSKEKNSEKSVTKCRIPHMY